MKLLTALTLCLTLLALCACGQPQPEQIATTPPTTTETTMQTTKTTQAPTTTQAPPPLPIKYPVSYRNAPEAYKPILDDLYKYVYVLSNGLDFDAYCGYDKTKIADAPSFAFKNGEFLHGTIGYAVKDINKDGILELILLSNSSYGSKEQFFLSLFTLKDNKPIHLDSYWRRSYGHFAADGTIYTVSHAGAATYNLTANRLKPGANELTELTQFYCYADFSAEPTVFFYRQVIGDEERDITHDKFQELHKLYSSPPNPMQFTFIPIEQ